MASLDSISDENTAHYLDSSYYAPPPHFLTQTIAPGGVAPPPEPPTFGELLDNVIEHDPFPAEHGDLLDLLDTFDCDDKLGGTCQDRVTSIARICRSVARLPRDGPATPRIETLFTRLLVFTIPELEHRITDAQLLTTTLQTSAHYGNCLSMLVYLRDRILNYCNRSPNVPAWVSARRLPSPP